MTLVTLAAAAMVLGLSGRFAFGLRPSAWPPGTGVGAGDGTGVMPQLPSFAVVKSNARATRPGTGAVSCAHLILRVLVRHCSEMDSVFKSEQVIDREISPMLRYHKNGLAFV